LEAAGPAKNSGKFNVRIMTDLEKYFRENDNRLIHKWAHYFDIYDRHFSRFRNKEIVILEIGVSQGGSLQMWKNYFGGKAKIYGVDINPKCKALEEENIRIFIGSQSDRNFLQEIKKQVPPIDILIDDGGHTMIQQIRTFEELFSSVKEDGVYLCEDLHTSYWLTYGGGHKRRGTFIEYSKNFIDYLNAHHSEQRSLRVSDFTNSVDSIHYYDSIFIIMTAYW
jgi:23S rRNA U2552 (ribose-2'-O)-methylase RlmE/FtsJ